MTSVFCYLYIRISLVLCMALTSDLSHLIHTGCWKITWRVLQSRLLSFDSFEVSATVVFLKMTHFLSIFFLKTQFCICHLLFFLVYDLRSFSSHISVLSPVLSVSFSVGFSRYLQIFFHSFILSPLLFFPSSSPLIPWNGRKLGFGCQNGVASYWLSWFLWCQAILWFLRGTGASVCPTLLVFRDENPPRFSHPRSAGVQSYLTA